MNEKGFARFRLSGEIYSHIPQHSLPGRMRRYFCIDADESFWGGDTIMNMCRHMFIEDVLTLMEQDDPV